MNTLEIFVSPNGDDSLSGSKLEPVKSLARARDLAREVERGIDDRVHIHLEAGTHRLQETLVLGPEDSHVSWIGEKGKSTISSGYPLTGWKKCDSSNLGDAGGNVWFVDLPQGTVVNTVYGEEGKIPRAKGQAIRPVELPFEEGDLDVLRYGPDGPFHVEKTVPRPEAVKHHDRFGFAPDAIVPSDDLDEAELLIIPAMQWTMNVLPLKEVDFENRIVYLAKPCTYPIGVPACAPEGSIWLENSLSVIRPGSWVYHSKTSRLYYCTTSEEPEQGLEAACLTEFIRVEGVHEFEGEQSPAHHISFENLTFTRSNRFSFHGLTGKGVQHDWEMHDAASCMLRFRHAQNCKVDQCHFTSGSSGGIRMDLASSGNRVSNSHFEHLGGCAVFLCGYGLSRHYLNRNNQVEHCHIHHIGESYWHSPGIFIWQSGDNHIASNHMHNLPYTAIVCSGRTLFDRDGVAECSGTIDWKAVEEQCGQGYEHNFWYYGSLPSWWQREPLMHSRENLIEYNHIHHVMEVMGDGNGIYISGAGGGNVARYNVVGPCPSPTFAEGLRCDDDQHQTIFHGNLIFGLHGHATAITLKGVNRVTNNIMALPLKDPDRGMLSLETGPLNGSVIQRNVILTSKSGQTMVNDLRIHGEGRKARLMDTLSDENAYFCMEDPEEGRRFLENIQSFGIDGKSMSCDPGFVDPSNGDFSLKPGAKALDIGFQPLPLEKMFCVSSK